MRLWKSEENVVSPPRAVGSYSRVLSWGGSSRCGFKEGCSNAGWRIDGSDWGQEGGEGTTEEAAAESCPGSDSAGGHGPALPFTFFLLLRPVPVPRPTPWAPELI